MRKIIKQVYNYCYKIILQYEKKFNQSKFLKNSESEGGASLIL